MIKWKYQSDGWRPDPSKLGKIIDVGGANSFCHGHLDGLIDIRVPQATANKIFIGDIDMPTVWIDAKYYTDEHGWWDYAVCTHTLEDICNPKYACFCLEKIAKRGLIVVPSKFREFSRFRPHHRGFMHHHWIFDVIDGQFTAFPKLNFIEDPIFDQVNKGEFFEELVIEWEGSIDLKVINDGMPYGTEKLSGEEHMMELYKKLIP